MGSVLGGVTDAIGLTNYKGEKRAAQAASEATKAATEMSKEQIQLAREELEFQKEQYYDWEGIYGSMQENLGDYYNNLDPDKLVAMGLENQQKEFQQAQEQIRRDFAQRGLSDSGLELTTTAQNKVQNATARATIRSSGDEMANAQKMQFLGLGLGQGTQMLGIIGNSASNVTSAFNTGISSQTNLAGSYINQHTNFSNANMAAVMKGVELAAAAAGSSDKNLKDNIKYYDTKNGHKRYTFNYKDGNTVFIGVIAQEVLEYLPEAISKDKNGYLTVDYSKLGFEMEKANVTS